MWFFAAQASVTAYFNYGVFNVPKQSPFLESYLSIIGKSAHHKAVNGGFQASINIRVNILKDGVLFKTESYNLLGPIDKDTASYSNFIDNQRYALSNGTYVFELVITDNYDATKKSFALKENVVINFTEKNLEASSIQPVESYVKAVTPGKLTKSGYDLIPYNVNYYPDNFDKLPFYFETYNADTVFGKNKNFLYSYFIQRKEDLQKVEGIGGFKKQNASVVNPLLASLDISKLPSGNYYLVIEVRDQNNMLQLEKKWFFQRSKVAEKKQPVVYKENRSVYEFFGNFNDADSLKMFVESLWPVSTSAERDWEINQTVKKDPQLMKNFIVDFWQRRAGDSLDPLQMWLNYYVQVTEVNKMFKCGKQKGYFTDRGRCYLQYGPPNQRVKQPSEPNSYPYEIWQYYRIKDNSSGQFYTNKKFVFVNQSIADDCFKLVHSTLRGEIYDEKWLFQIAKRSAESNNMDKTTPDASYGSQALDLFNNPR